MSVNRNHLGTLREESDEDRSSQQLPSSDLGSSSLTSRPSQSGSGGGRRPISRPRSGLFSAFSFRGSGGSLDDNILRQSALLRSTARSSTASDGRLPATFGRRSSTVRTPGAGGAAGAAAVVQEQDKARATYRRYRVGDSVLVCNTQSRWANLVNRYGYPAGGGVTPEEQRGPYIYVLATVRKVHFEEDAEYYTVTRADTGADQRADAGE